MTNKQIKSLETRFKATFLLLAEAGLDEDASGMIDLAQERFDSEDYDGCEEALNAIDSVVVEIFEN